MITNHDKATLEGDLCCDVPELCQQAIHTFDDDEADGAAEVVEIDENGITNVEDNANVTASVNDNDDAAVVHDKASEASRHAGNTEDKTKNEQPIESGAERVTDQTDDHHDDDDTSYDVNLDDMLENLDIDRDFTMWSSFRNSIDEMRSPRSDANDLNMIDEENEEENRARWQARIDRDEVYSKRYRPSTDESQEMQALERIFQGRGSSKPSSGRLLGDLLRNASQGRNRSGRSLTPQEQFAALVHPDDGQPHSILLKRGPLLVNEQEAELVLFTHGLVVALTAPMDNSESPRPKVVPRTLHRVIAWTHVTCVVPGRATLWTLQLEHDRLEMTCATTASQQAWLQALERVLLEHDTHHARQKQFTLGWQHLRVRHPAFYAAVSGQAPENGKMSQHVNVLDRYNGLAPLHYAVRLQHADACRVLLQVGADVNLPDQDGYLPLDYALRDESKEIAQLLQEHGAKTGKSETTGELFGRVEASERNTNDRRQREQQQEEAAAAAQAKMAENMRLLQERGEKIQDMDDKARALNENARNFKDMARELKARSKKQSKWNPFA